jgi:hypothetical protein
MTTPGIGEKATDEQVADWRSSHKMYERAASVIATWATGKKRGTVLPDNSVFQYALAEMTGDEPSPSVWKRAKVFLVAQGVLSRNDGLFQVALPPGGEGGPAGRGRLVEPGRVRVCTV